MCLANDMPFGRGSNSVHVIEDGGLSAWDIVTTGYDSYYSAPPSHDGRRRFQPLFLEQTLFKDFVAGLARALAAGSATSARKYYHARKLVLSLPLDHWSSSVRRKTKPANPTVTVIDKVAGFY